MSEGGAKQSALEDRRERRRALLVLALVATVFVVYAALFIPHLTNNFFGDVEFTGWCGPIGRWIAHGARPYIDFVLPIPPGSFAILALIGKLLGRFLLQDELWLNALCQLAMALLAYVIAARFTTRENALAVSICSLIVLLELNKECAYDPTAQLTAWGSIAVGVAALCARGRRARRARWAVAGLLAGFTLAFKQSTGVGAIGGWLVAIAYLWFAERLAGARDRARERLDDGAAWLVGVAGGLVLVAALVLALRGSLSGFIQAVFIDGPKLKGGSGHLVVDLFGYLARSAAFIASIGFLFGLSAVGLRLVMKNGGLHVGDEPRRRAPLTWRRALALAAVALVTFGTAGGLLLSHYRGIRPKWVRVFDGLHAVPSFGLAFLCVFFVAHCVRVPRDDDEERVDANAARGGHVFNAAVIVALSVSLLHNTSAPEFRAFYDNNPIIPFALLALFVALDRARLAPFKALAIVLTLASLFGNRLDRALRARIPMGSRGYWAGMYVSSRGRDIALAALEVRSLTSPTDTVLVLPEDVNLAALIGRPRPPLKGAIVFVDQYPKRLAAADIRVLHEHPPKVVVLNPTEKVIWQQLFRVWSGKSGAERVIDFVEKDLLPGHYELAATAHTRFLWQPTTLQVWVRK
jgi:hypothetical protein